LATASNARRRPPFNRSYAPYMPKSHHTQLEYTRTARRHDLAPAICTEQKRLEHDGEENMHTLGTSDARSAQTRQRREHGLRPATKALLVAFASRFASRELLLQLRWELILNSRSLIAAIDPRQRFVLARIRQGHPTLRVNLGCGPFPAAGWLNVDGVAPQADLIQYLGHKLNLPDRCASLAFSEHVLEHLQFPEQTQTFMSEAFRILKPGGHFRVIVPDAQKMMEAYVAANSQSLRQPAPLERTEIDAVNKLFREGSFHRFAWDFDFLKMELERVGFAKTRRARFRDSTVHELNIDFDQPERVGQSLYVETCRPL
jgi:predicted SAM-dependent methyltransferase